MNPAETLQLIACLAARENRAHAAQTLAKHVGAEDLIIFMADPEIGALIPAQGFPATLAGAFMWQGVLSQAVCSGACVAEVPYPDESTIVRCDVRAPRATAAIAFLGGLVNESGVSNLLHLLPLLEATFQAEQTAINALATTALARNATKQMREQATSLEEARRSAHEYLLERRRAEKELELKAHELERSNRDLQQFGSMVSHDLQEPLRMVSNYLNLVEITSSNVLSEKSKGYVAHARTGAQRMTALIRALLDYAKVGAETPAFVMVPMEMVIREAIDNLSERVAEVQAHIQFNEQPSVAGVHMLLVQLMQNLLSNAMKFRNKNVEPRIIINAQCDQNVWRFTIADNGIGIAAEDQHKIFGVFQRLHTAHEYEGTGIGLATCRRIVDTHRGQIGVSSVPGEGSSFWFTLPVP